MIDDNNKQTQLETTIEALRSANDLLQQLNDGERVIVPKNKEHAENMIIVARFYLDTYEENMSINRFLK